MTDVRVIHLDDVRDVPCPAADCCGVCHTITLDRVPDLANLDPQARA